MDCNHAQAPEYTDPNWYSHSDWSKGAQGGTPEGFLQDANYMYSKGKGGSKGTPREFTGLVTATPYSTVSK